MSTISRRSVTKGAAWAVPAVAIGAAVPAFAVSGEVTVTATGCRGTGNQSKTARFTISASGNGRDAVVSITGVNGDGGGYTINSFSSSCPQPAGCNTITRPVCAPAVGSGTGTLTATASNAGFTTATISYVVYDRETCQQIGTGTVTVSTIPDCPGGLRNAEPVASTSTSTATEPSSSTSSTPPPSTSAPTSSAPSADAAPSATPSPAEAPGATSAPSATPDPSTSTPTTQP